MRGALAVALVLASTVAHAEPTTPKSETTALALSTGGTLVSLGLMASGLAANDDEQGMQLLGAGVLSLAVTPSLGHFYAGEVLTAGLGLRAAGALATSLAVYQAFECWERSCSFYESGGAALALGGGLVAAGAIWDIATAPSAARRHNARHVSLVPASTGANIGLSLTGQF